MSPLRNPWGDPGATPELSPDRTRTAKPRNPWGDPGATPELSPDRTRTAKPRQTDWERNIELNERARRMQAFYEPAWYGQPSSYDMMYPYQRDRSVSDSGVSSSGMLPPPTIGGFATPGPTPYTLEEAKAASEQLSRSALGSRGAEEYLGTPEQMVATSGRVADMWRQEQAYGGPPIGMANLDKYGQGQLENYGMGELRHYGQGDQDQVSNYGVGRRAGYRPMMRDEFLRRR